MKTVLILDDETAVRQSFADYFEDQLWDVIQAASAEEAIQLLEHKIVQAAVVDVRLPGLDGNEFIRRYANKKSILPLSSVQVHRSMSSPLIYSTSPVSQIS